MRRSSLIGFLLIFVIALGPSGVGYFVLQQVEQRMSLEVEGTWVPKLFLPSFRLKNARISWDDRVQLLSGDIDIQYDPFSYFRRDPLGVKISGKMLDVELLGDWAKMQSASRVKLDQFYADIAIGNDRIEVLNEIEAYGPQFQFSIKAN